MRLDALLTHSFWLVLESADCNAVVQASDYETFNLGMNALLKVVAEIFM